MKAPRSCSPATCCTRCSRCATGSASSSRASSWPVARPTSSPRRPATARSRSRSSPRHRSMRCVRRSRRSGRDQGRSRHRDKNMLVVTANRDVRAELARALVEAGHPPYHLRRRGDELDEIYRRYFAANEPAESASMTGQADSLPAARRRKRKNIRVQSPETPPQRTSRSPPRRRPMHGPRFRAGWRDHRGQGIRRSPCELPLPWPDHRPRARRCRCGLRDRRRDQELCHGRVRHAVAVPRSCSRRRHRSRR